MVEAPSLERPDPLDDQTVIVASDASGDALLAATVNAGQVEALPFRDDAGRSAARVPAFLPAAGQVEELLALPLVRLDATTAAEQCRPDAVPSEE